MSTRNSSSWVFGLPVEIAENVLYPSFVSNVDNQQHSRMTPADPQPNLSLSRVNKELRQYFETSFLPDSIVIFVESHVCEACNTAGARRWANLFSSSDSQPWISILDKASTVTIDVRCAANIAASFKVATFYVPRNKLSILALSQMMLGPNRDQGTHASRTITMHLHPRSALGVQLSLEVLDLFAKLLHSIVSGVHSVSPYTAPNLRAALAEAGIQRLFPIFQNWAEAKPVHEALFQEFQILMDTKAVAVHRMAEISLAACKNFARGWAIPVPTENSPDMPVAQMDDFTCSHLNINCTLFLVLHGLVGYMIQQFRKSNALSAKRSLTRVVKDIRRLEEVLLTMWHQWRVVCALDVSQELGEFRPWIQSDVPFLIHYTAMVQTFTRVRILGFTHFLAFQVKPSYANGLALLINPSPDQDLRAVYSAIERSIMQLETWDQQISDLRKHTGGQTQFQIYDEYEVSSFTTSMRKVLKTLDEVFKQRHLQSQTTHSGHTAVSQGKVMNQWYADLEAKGVFDPPRRLRIPTIPTSDWAMVRRTFGDINQKGFWWCVH